MNAQFSVRLLLLGLLVLTLTAGCGPGYVRYNAATGERTDSWDWLWTSVIAVVVFVVGFVVGATMSRNGGIRLTHHRHHHRRHTEAGWNRIRQHIQTGTDQALAEWRRVEQTGDANWGDLTRRIEERIVEEMRDHHD